MSNKRSVGAIERRRAANRERQKQYRKDPLFRKLEYERIQIWRGRKAIERLISTQAAHERVLMRRIKRRDKLAAEWREQRKVLARLMEIRAGN